MEEKERPNWEWLNFLNKSSFWHVVYAVIILLIIIVLLRSYVGCMNSVANSVNDTTTSLNEQKNSQEKKQKEDTFVGTYNIGNDLGTMVINEDKTVRITIQGKTYAGSLHYYDDFFGKDCHISLTEWIPVEWGYTFWGKYVKESTSYLYIDEQRQFLYFDDTALDAKDENKRWEITKVNPNSNPTEYPQEENDEGYYQKDLESDYDSSNGKIVYSISDDGFLNIREAPSDKSAILRVLHTGGDGAELLDNSSKWYKVKKGDVIGYVYSKYAYISP